MRSTSKFVLSLLVCASSLPSAHLTTKSNPDKFLGAYPIPPKTPGSININTTNAKPVKLKFFRYTAGVFESVDVVNTGKSVEVSLAQTNTISTATGGPFLDDTYVLYKVRFYWSNNRTDAVHTSVDGQSAQLIVVSYFCNKKYGSFNNAIKYRDGLAEVHLPVTIGGSKNPVFTRFAKVLRKVRKPGSKAVTDFGNTFVWFNFVTLFAKYYAYPGSYTDEKTGLTYYCTTTLIYTAASTRSISRRQFGYTFGSLEGANGNPLENINSPKPSKAPIVQAAGTIQFFVPTSI